MKFILTSLFLICWAALSAQPKTGPNKIDSLGRKQGYWVKYSKDTLKYEGTFENDIPVGEFKYYYPDKKIKSIVHYSEKGIKAMAVDYHPNGKKLAEGMYWDKKKNGIWKYYNTQEKLVKQEQYYEGIPDGTWITYYPDGKVNEIYHYKYGKKQGEWVRYLPDSLLWFRGNYENNMLNGLFSYYNLKGQLVLSGYYKDDLKIGYWIYYDNVGRAIRRLNYVDGIKQKEEITLFENDTQISWINVDDIAYVFSNDGKVIIRTNQGKDHITLHKIDDFEKLLPDGKFFRINPLYYVSIWSIANREKFSPDERVLILKPPAPSKVIVAENVIDGFMSWADLIKGEYTPRNKDPQDPY